MNRVKQSKKRWAWTKAQRRRHQNYKTGSNSPPSWICRVEHRENKTYVKKFLHKVINGYDADFLNIKIKNQDSSAGYNWW